MPQGRLQTELRRLGRIPLLVIDEVGYIPFEAEAANLFFQLISNRYERASVIVTSDKPFGRWGEVFGDATVAAAMIDLLVHHAEVISLKGDSYRLKDRDLGRVPNDRPDAGVPARPRWATPLYANLHGEVGHGPGHVARAAANRGPTASGSSQRQSSRDPHPHWRSLRDVADSADPLGAMA